MTLYSPQKIETWLLLPLPLCVVADLPVIIVAGVGMDLPVTIVAGFTDDDIGGWAVVVPIG